MINYQETEIKIGNAKFRFTTDAQAIKPAHSKAHSHTNYELFFVWEGEVEIRTDNEIFSAEDNQAVLIAPTYYHQSFTKDDSKKINLYFSFTKTGKHTKSKDIYSEFEKAFSKVSVLRIENTREIEKYLSAFKSISSEECFGKEERISAILKSFIFAMYDCLTDKCIEEIHFDSISKTGENYGYEIDNLLNRNFSEKIDLDYLAEKLCLSPKRVSVIIKSLYGKSFRQVKTEMKIQLAKQLLRETDLTISQIAQNIGYDSTRGFLTAFSQMTKMTPSQYRESKRKP